jgi:hypothetical protein
MTSDFNEYMRVVDLLASGEGALGLTTMTATPHGATPTTLADKTRQLENVLPPELMEKLTIQETNEAALRDTLAGVEFALVEFNSADSNFNQAVEKFGEAAQLIIDKLGDTASPRRQALSAMGSHSMFDAQIAGKRTVTSGQRNFALGSMNSDHAAGRAYDLVGQNLGLYGQAIRQAGGFAEFHGNGAGRHLHVVPGGVPVGDTATPFIASPVMASSSNSSSTVNIVVNAPQGMDVQALASEVASRIERAQKSRNERY